MKKSQITLFIALGVLVLILVMIIMLARNIELDEIQIPVRISAEDIYESILLCNQLIAYEGAYHLARYGGYYEPPELTIIETYDSVLKFNNTRQNHPEINEVAENYETYIRKYLPLCVRTVIESPRDIETGQLTIEAEIYENVSIISIKYPINTTLGNTELTFEEYPPIIVPVRLGYLHNETNRFLDNPGTGFFSTNPAVTISYYISENTALLVIEDNTSSILSPEGTPGIKENNLKFKYVFSIIADDNVLDDIRDNWDEINFDDQARYSSAKFGCRFMAIHLSPTIDTCMTVNEWRLFVDDFCSPFPRMYMNLANRCEID